MEEITEKKNHIQYPFVIRMTFVKLCDKYSISGVKNEKARVVAVVGRGLVLVLLAFQKLIEKKNDEKRRWWGCESGVRL